MDSLIIYQQNQLTIRDDNHIQEIMIPTIQSIHHETNEIVINTSTPIILQYNDHVVCELVFNRIAEIIGINYSSIFQPF